MIIASDLWCSGNFESGGDRALRVSVQSQSEEGEQDSFWKPLKALLVAENLATSMALKTAAEHVKDPCLYHLASSYRLLWVPESWAGVGQHKCAVSVPGCTAVPPLLLTPPGFVQTLNEGEISSWRCCDCRCLENESGVRQRRGQEGLALEEIMLKWTVRVLARIRKSSSHFFAKL